MMYLHLKLLFGAAEMQKILQFDIYQKNTFSDFSIKYKFGTKNCSEYNRTVFMKSLYFLLMRTGH